MKINYFLEEIQTKYSIDSTTNRVWKRNHTEGLKQLYIVKEFDNNPLKDEYIQRSRIAQISTLKVEKE